MIGCVTFLGDIRLRGIDAIVTDPPYGECGEFEESTSPKEAACLVEQALQSVPLPLNGLACVFWTMRSLDLMLDTVRRAGLTYRRTLTMYLPNGSARPFRGWLPRVQPILVAQRYSPRRSAAFHRRVAAYLRRAMTACEVSRSELARRVGCDPRLVRKWTHGRDPGWCLPTPRFYRCLKRVLKLDGTFDCLLDRAPASAHPQREFAYHHDCYVVESARNGSGQHPAEKPLSVVQHLVDSASDEGVIDPFMGSGTTGVACVRAGRRFVGIERNKKFFRRAVKRIEGELSGLRSSDAAEGTG